MKVFGLQPLTAEFPFLTANWSPDLANMPRNFWPARKHAWSFSASRTRAVRWHLKTDGVLHRSFPNTQYLFPVPNTHSYLSPLLPQHSIYFPFPTHTAIYPRSFPNTQYLFPLPNTHSYLSPLLPQHTVSISPSQHTKLSIPWTSLLPQHTLSISPSQHTQLSIPWTPLSHFGLILVLRLEPVCAS